MSASILPARYFCGLAVCRFCAWAGICRGCFVAFLFAVNSQDLLNELAFIADDPLEKVSLRPQDRPGNLEVQVAVPAILRYGKVFFNFIRNFSAQELAQGKPSGEIKLLC